jgi:hypothetical protein
MGDDRVARLRFPRPRYPECWNDGRLFAAPFRRTIADPFEERDAAVSMIRPGGDVAAAIVVFDDCVTVYDLQRRCDAADPLSAAILT